MSYAIEIIDPDGERRYARRRRLLMTAILVSLVLFAYPQTTLYATKWNALKAGRKFALYLSMIKSKAILTQSPLEVRFKEPDLLEVFEVSSCGPFAEKKKLWDAKLSDFEPGVRFVTEAWARENIGTREPLLPRFCYDPLFGSSIAADGLVHGAVFIAHQSDISARLGEQAVQITIEGGSGDLSIE